VLKETYRGRARIGPRDSWFVKYAFVRPRVCVSVDDPLGIVNLGPEEMAIGGLKEFLEATAPGVDLVVVGQALRGGCGADTDSWWCLGGTAGS
jgi:hypothetical protein